MVKNARTSRVELSDMALERASVFTGLLDNIQTGRSITSHSRRLIIIRLAQKYECQTVLTRIILQSKSDLAKNPTRLSPIIFRMAILLNDADLASQVLKLSGGATWTSRDLSSKAESADKDFDCLVGASTMDPGGLALSHFRQFDVDTLWIWLRAHRHAFGSQSVASKIKFEAISQEFLRLKQLP